MGRKRHDKLAGMAQLGARLRQLREKAGLSQMKLAAKMGFVPPHGYKYVFRLEKGQVPNPTLRTIASYLDACAAGWQEIIDLLPASASPKQTAREPAPANRPPPETKPEPVPAPPKDTRPLRLKVRSELLTQRQEHARTFWTKFEQVEQKAAEMLQSHGIVSNQQRHYFAFVRSCCSMVDAYAGSRPGLLDKELGKVVKAAKESGLNEKTLLALRSSCLEFMGTAKAEA
jgi:transcriptional regulator with XRE-family HTH domain